MPSDWTEFREPFAGGLSVTIALLQRHPVRKFWVNDIDPYLSCFWKVLACQPDRLAETLHRYLTEFLTDEDKRCLFEWSRAVIHESEGVDRAALYYILSKTSYDCLAMGGSFVDPRAFNASAVEKLRAVGKLLGTVNLRVTNSDYADCLTDDPTVFTYFDPPYLIPGMLYGVGGKIHRQFDHRRFAGTVNGLKSRWMVSYNDHLLIRHRFKERNISTIELPYLMGKRRKVQELVITNFNN